jgi:hypothetical protein
MLAAKDLRGVCALRQDDPFGDICQLHLALASIAIRNADRSAAAIPEGISIGRAMANKPNSRKVPIKALTSDGMSLLRSFTGGKAGARLSACLLLPCN